jgi:transmembrane sensor
VTDHSDRSDREGAAELSPLAREAIAWLLRLTCGAATTQDADQFKRWRAQSPEHAAAWQEAVRLWRALGPALEELQREEPREAEELARRMGWHPSFRPKSV